MKRVYTGGSYPSPKKNSTGNSAVFSTTASTEYLIPETSTNGEYMPFSHFTLPTAPLSYSRPSYPQSNQSTLSPSYGAPIPQAPYFIPIDNQTTSTELNRSINPSFSYGHSYQENACNVYSNLNKDSCPSNNPEVDDELAEIFSNQASTSTLSASVSSSSSSTFTTPSPINSYNTTDYFAHTLATLTNQLNAEINDRKNKELEISRLTKELEKEKSTKINNKTALECELSREKNKFDENSKRWTRERTRFQNRIYELEDEITRLKNNKNVSDPQISSADFAEQLKNKQAELDSKQVQINKLTLKLQRLTSENNLLREDNIKLRELKIQPLKTNAYYENEIRQLNETISRYAKIVAKYQDKLANTKIMTPQHPAAQMGSSPYSSSSQTFFSQPSNLMPSHEQQHQARSNTPTPGYSPGHSVVDLSSL